MSAPSTSRYSIGQVWRDWREDIRAFVRIGLQPKSGFRGRVQRFGACFMPPVLCCLAYRISRWFFTHHCRWLAGALARLVHAGFGSSISPASRLGPGLYLPHPNATVIQADAGRGLQVYAGGSVYCHPWRPLNARPLRGAPTLGDNVVIGAKASVKGPLRLGNNVIVSFMAVLERDVPDGFTAMQSPLRNYRVMPARKGEVK